MMIYFASVGWNILYTVLIAFALVFVYYFQNKIVQLHQLDKKRAVLYFAYILLFFIFTGAIVGTLFIWEYDFNVLGGNIIELIKTIFSDHIEKLLGSVFAWFVAVMIVNISKLGLMRVGMKESALQKRKKTIAKVTISIVKYVVYIIAILIILALWNVNVVPALAGLGIAGIVLGLGAQKFINDLISGFFIIFEHHFDVGEIIDVGGFKGEVIDIGLKTTKIRNWRGEVKIIANGDINNVSNFSRNPSIGIIDFGIAYQEDMQKTIDILKVELPKIRPLFPDILEDPQVVGVIELANSSVNMRVIVKTVTEKHYAIERAIRQRIKEVLDQNNIEIPFPQVVVHQSND